MIPTNGDTSRVCVVLAVLALAAGCGLGTDRPSPDAPAGNAASSGPPLTEVVHTTDWHDLKLIESLRAFIPTVMDEELELISGQLRNMGVPLFGGRAL